MRLNIILAFCIAGTLSIPFDQDVAERALEDFDDTFGVSLAPQYRDSSTASWAGLTDRDEDDDDDGDDDDATASITVRASRTDNNKRAVPSTYKQIAVFAHNLHRKNHSAPAISWDPDLAQAAKDLAKQCVFKHNTGVGGGGYGQNIAAGIKSNNISAIITNLWYNSEVNWFRGLYGQPQPSMKNFAHWGHFSQVVWDKSISLGCATFDCSKKGLQGVGSNVPPYFTVCNYKSPGNFANEYGKNIGRSLGHPTANWNTGLGHR